MSTDDPDLPLPDSILSEAGFSLAERRSESLFEFAAIRIDGFTQRYEDDRSREALREATDGAVDHPIRFFAVTRLSFQPALPPGVSLSMFASTVRSEARSSFQSQLENRGLVDVERGASERHRLPEGSRLRVRRFTARDPLPEADGESLALAFRLSVLTHKGTALVVTAGFPATPLAEQFDLSAPADILTTTPEQYQETFVDLLAGVHERLTA